MIFKRIVQDMDKAYFPAKTIVPSTRSSQRHAITLELFRGCITDRCQGGIRLPSGTQPQQGFAAAIMG